MLRLSDRIADMGSSETVDDVATAAADDEDESNPDVSNETDGRVVKVEGTVAASPRFLG